MGNYYVLYHDKKNLAIKLKTKKITNNKHSIETYIDNDKIIMFNSNHFVCGDRKALKEFADKMKQEWISELEGNLLYIKSIKL